MFKVLICFLAILLVVCAVLSLCTGCATRPVVVATDDSIISAASSAARLEAANEYSRELLQFATDENRLLNEAIGSGRGGIDLALELLDKYDGLFQECIRRIAELEYLTRSGEIEKRSPDEDAADWDNPFLY